jgi:hypothetical protein
MGAKINLRRPPDGRVVGSPNSNRTGQFTAEFGYEKVLQCERWTTGYVGQVDRQNIQEVMLSGSTLAPLDTGALVSFQHSTEVIKGFMQ